MNLNKIAQSKREKEGSEAEYAEDFLISKDEYVNLKTKIEKYERKVMIFEVIIDLTVKIVERTRNSE